MLNSTGNTCGNINFRSYSFTCLTYLMQSINPTGIDSCTRCTYSTAQNVRQFFQHTGERFISVHAATACDDNIGFFNLNTVAAHFNEFYKLRQEIGFRQIYMHIDNFTGCIRISFRFLKYVRTNRTHLRTIVTAHDFSHNVAAQCRTSPNDSLAVIINKKVSAVCRQTGLQCIGNTGAQITPDIRSTYEVNIRFHFVEEMN